jgi:membrane protein
MPHGKRLSILKDALANWWARDPLSLSAAASYYAIFSLPGFLITIFSVAAMTFQRNRVEAPIFGHITAILGQDFSDSLRALLENSQGGDRGFWGILIGTATLAFGATGLFSHLQATLNGIWDVKAKKGGQLLLYLKSRALALATTILLGLLLLASLFVTAFLTAADAWLAHYFAPSVIALFLSLNYVVSLALISLLFALLYKILPDVELAWTDALKGGIVASILFTAGEYGLGLYFRIVKPGSAFGAAGSFILFLIWIHYSCLVLLFGAEFIRSIVKDRHKKPKPTKLAKRSPA